MSLKMSHHRVQIRIHMLEWTCSYKKCKNIQDQYLQPHSSSKQNEKDTKMSIRYYIGLKDFLRFSVSTYIGMLWIEGS